MKKFLPLLLSFIILGTAVPTLAQVQNTLILVSDNEADLALAQKVGELLNAEVVVTPWGVYNESISVEIIEKNPSLVLIIGGPKAVSPQYEVDLQSVGIPYVRRWGATRVETATSVINFIRKDYPHLFKGVKLVVVYGWDLAGLSKLRELMRENNVIPVYISNNSTNVPVNWSGKLIVIETPFSKNIIRRLHLYGPIIVKANVTREVAEEAIEKAERAIKRAEVISRLSGLSLGLESAYKFLGIAKEAYSQGDYLKAYNFANLARAKAERIIATGIFAKPRVKMPPKLELQIQIKFLKLLTMRLEAQGVDVRGVKELIARAEDALNQGNISLAIKYVNEARELLRYIHRGREGWKGKKRGSKRVGS